MNQATQHADVLEFPQHRTHRNYSCGYLDGLGDGEKHANTMFVWLGAAIGIVLSSIVVLAVLAYIGFFQ